MTRAFRPASIDRLGRWIFGDLDGSDTVLGIPKGNFRIPSPRVAGEAFGRPLAAPLGVAAGPHTQLAQNIAAAWLCGARFVELKTVQAKDDLDVPRPCIDSTADETWNCEWSQELRLAESFREYLNAWVLLHALAHRLGRDGPGVHFATSVGYDLDGIRSAPVQAFLASMRDAGDALDEAVERLAPVYPPVREIPIPRTLSNHVTLSTMHGCPPVEIERIASYLLRDLRFATWVKLNPTLLGPERLRAILGGPLGWDIEVPDAAFAHDPRFDDAMAMVSSLSRVAAEEGLPFGLKLSNTLEVTNRRGVFPPTETMAYLSGRPLHPLTLTLAHLVTEAHDGRVPISFCGGADATNFPDLVADGLGPVTVCTDLLKPGGYARLGQYLDRLDEEMAAAGAADLDAFVGPRGDGDTARRRLARHAAAVASDPHRGRRERPVAFKGTRPLGTFDCVAAPCQEACPSHQDIADYLWQVARGNPDAALDVILRSNPLPGITGSVCDHPCTDRCVRNFYDTAVAIREVKRHAFERGTAAERAPRPPNGLRVAIVGAGPAGLAAAEALAGLGFGPVVFEAKEEAGGMVGGVIPAYRLSADTLHRDLDRLRRAGVEIRFRSEVGKNPTLDELRRDFAAVVLAAGAQRGKRLGLAGEAGAVVDALAFLDGARGANPPALGPRVLVIGGGNTAMDAARTARRLAPDAEVTLVYRRTRAQMPADPDEVRDALAEGVRLRDLLAPESIERADGRLVGLACRPMRLGEPDPSGRPKPVPADGPPVLLPADTILAAIGQEPVLDFLAPLVLAANRDGTLVVDPATRETSVPGLYAGGDLVRGPSSVIEAIADGRAAALAIARRAGVEPPPEPPLDKGASAAQQLAKKGRLVAPRTVPLLPVADRAGFEEVVLGLSPDEARAEAERCLDCDDLCSLCVTVCPNRANVAWATEPFRIELPRLELRGGRLVERERRAFSVHQPVQILNVGDFCNECGNCVPFCPTAGSPWRGKPRFWIDRAGFDEAAGDAWRMTRDGETLVVEAKLDDRLHRLERSGDRLVYRTDRLEARLAAGTGELLEVTPAPLLPEGAQVDLAPLATLIPLLAAETPLLLASTEDRR